MKLKNYAEWRKCGCKGDVKMFEKEDLIDAIRNAKYMVDEEYHPLISAEECDTAYWVLVALEDYINENYDK